MTNVSTLLLLVALLLGGCVSAQPTYLASGQKGHVISCSPAMSTGLIGMVASASTNWGTCYQKAGEICGSRGFNVIEKSGEQGAALIGGNGGMSAATTNNRMMVVECKGAA